MKKSNKQLIQEANLTEKPNYDENIASPFDSKLKFQKIAKQIQSGKYSN